MLGTILILDGISTNRIMLKVQLSASYYHVVQADRIADLPSLLRRCRPDLILTAMRLPDGNAMDVGRIIGQPDLTPRIPIIAIAAENDKKDDACHYREKGASSLKTEVRQHARTPFKVRGTQGVGKQAMGGP